MNSVNLTGRLTRDIDLRKTQSGKSVTTFSLAVDKRKKGEANFITCVAWGETAENMKKYLRKGSKIGVSGSLEVRTYEKDGRKEYKTEVKAETVEFLETRKQDKSDFEVIENDGD